MSGAQIGTSTSCLGSISPQTLQDAQKTVLDELEDEETNIQLPSDTMAAMQLLRHDFPSTAKVIPLLFY